MVSSLDNDSFTSFSRSPSPMVKEIHVRADLRPSGQVQLLSSDILPFVIKPVSGRFWRVWGSRACALKTLVGRSFDLADLRFAGTHEARMAIEATHWVILLKDMTYCLGLFRGTY